jgi:hypothetical protein
MIRDEMNRELQAIRENVSRELQALREDMRRDLQTVHEMRQERFPRGELDGVINHNGAVHPLSTPPPEPISYAQPLPPTSPTESNLRSSPPLTRLESLSGRASSHKFKKKSKHSLGECPKFSRHRRKTKQAMRSDRATRRMTTTSRYQVFQPAPTPFKIVGQPHQIARNERQVRNEHTDAG